MGPIAKAVQDATRFISESPDPSRLESLCPQAINLWKSYLLSSENNELIWALYRNEQVDIPQKGNR